MNFKLSNFQKSGNATFKRASQCSLRKSVNKLLTSVNFLKLTWRIKIYLNLARPTQKLNMKKISNLRKISLVKYQILGRYNEKIMFATNKQINFTWSYVHWTTRRIILSERLSQLVCLSYAPHIMPPFPPPSIAPLHALPISSSLTPVSLPLLSHYFKD